MKKFLPSLLCLSYLLIFASGVFAAAPTVPSGNPGFGSIDGTTMSLNWVPGNGTGRIVIVRAGSPVDAVPVNGIDYNESPIFGDGDAIKPGQFVVYDNTNQFVPLTGLQPNTVYYFRIYEYNGTGATTEYLTASFATGNQSTAITPGISATNLTFSNVTGNAVTLTWDNGNGERRIVVARAGSAVNANPVDLSFYSASNSFGFGTEIGTGNFVVYYGSGNTVDVSGLLPGTNYHFAVYEFNGFSTPVYRIPLPATGNQLTNLRPSSASDNISYSNIEGASISLSWTRGNGTSRIVIARAGSPVDAVPADGIEYAENNNFQLADEISAGQKVVYSNTSSFFTMSGLLPGTIYYFRIYEFDGTGASTGYLTTSFATGSQSTATAPSTSSGNIAFSNVTGSTATLKWTIGDGERRIVVARAATAVNATPVDLTNYSASPTFSFGDEIGTGNFVVFNGTGNSVDLTGLKPGLTYHFAVYEFNGFTTPVYRIASPAIASLLTDSRPTSPSTGITFSNIDGASLFLNWIAGNGVRRIVVARAGSPVDAMPTDGIDYADNNNFQLAGEISPGQRVVFDNTNSSLTLSGLQPGTDYYFRIYEYNGTGAGSTYLTTSFGNANQSTATAPGTSASNIVFSAVTGNAMTLTWTSGSGERRLVVARAATAVNASPVDLTYYSASSTFSFGDETGTGNFVVFNGTGNSVDLTGLQPGLTYHFAVYEFNGFSAPVYRIASPATASQTTDGAPSVPSSNLNFSNIDGSSLFLNWTPGNGNRRIVIARAGSPVDALPLNGIDYTENNNFQLAGEVSPGQKCVYDNTSSGFTLSGLLPNTIYYFRIYEYNGTGAGIVYLTANPATGNQSTVTTPTLQSSNISFTAVTGNSVTIGWTNGNGEGRLVVARANTAVNADPVDLVSYTANTSFGSGSEAGTGNFVITYTTGTNINVTGLVPGTTYHFSVYEYNGSGSPVYLRPGAIGNVTTIGAPQIQATNVSAASVGTTTIQLIWTNGSGNRRLVLMKQGTAVDANPVDNMNYIPNSAFGSGAQLGTGNYVVFNATGNSLTVTGLATNTVYHFAVFEYNAFGVNSQFLITNPARGNAVTSFGLPVKFLEFNAEKYKNSIQLKWSTGQENNSSNFEIEKSADGISFTMIGTVQAAGNSNARSEYSYIDADPWIMNYYRLREVDLDNRAAFSKTIWIKYEPVSLVKKIINPIQNTLSVQLDVNAIPTGSEWILYDMNGKMVRRGRISNAHINETISWLTAGMYLLEIRLGEIREITRLIKF